MRPLIRIALGVVVFSGILTVPATAHVPKKSGAASASRRARSSVTANAPFLKKIVAWQRQLQSKIAGLARQMKKDFSGWHLVVLVLIAMLYGSIHALGPGHGKIVLGSCAVGQEFSIIQAVKAAGVFSAVHNGSAIVLWTLFMLIFGTFRRRTSHDITTVMYNISGGLLMVLGVFLLVTMFLKKKTRSSLPEKLEYNSLPLACAAAGAVPCPGTLVLLFFGGSLGMVWLGYVMALSFTVGMLITLGTVAMLFASGRKLAGIGVHSQQVFAVLRGVGAVLLILVGLYVVLLY